MADRDQGGQSSSQREDTKEAKRDLLQGIKVDHTPRHNPRMERTNCLLDTNDGRRNLKRLR